MLEGWVLKGYEQFLILSSTRILQLTQHSIFPSFQLGRSLDFEIIYFVYETKSRKNINTIPI
jgi:hypothetical protein